LKCTLTVSFEYLLHCQFFNFPYRTIVFRYHTPQNVFIASVLSIHPYILLQTTCVLPVQDKVKALLCSEISQLSWNQQLSWKLGAYAC